MPCQWKLTTTTANYRSNPSSNRSRTDPTSHTGTGECKHLISSYLKCLKSKRGVNDEDCRMVAKDYLGCRMEKYVSHFRASVGVSLVWLDIMLTRCHFCLDRNLMAPDDFKNLGLIFEKQESQGKGNTSGGHDENAASKS